MLQRKTLSFLSAIKKNNNKEWFDSHRKEYETAKKDFENFVSQLLNALTPLEPALATQAAKECSYRIFRDVRFSKDKTPYIEVSAEDHRHASTECLREHQPGRHPRDTNRRLSWRREHRRTVRQTLLAFEARGPHLLGARSSADLSVDFNGSTQPSDSATPYSGYYSAAALLRLRTVHASLDWQHGRAYFALDRPIISPDAPTSLTAVAEPALAWSGNLWTWNPQIGGTGDLQFRGSHYLRLQTALIDVGDAPLSAAAGATASPGPPPSAGEQSRWPGTEARIAILGADRENGSHLGFGGYFSPHLSPFHERFDAWAGTLDARLLLPMGLQFTGSFYRGAALGGLGGGGYKDYGYRLYSNGSGYSFRPLDDVGGWAQLNAGLA